MLGYTPPSSNESKIKVYEEVRKMWAIWVCIAIFVDLLIYHW